MRQRHDRPRRVDSRSRREETRISHVKILTAEQLPSRVHNPAPRVFAIMISSAGVVGIEQQVVVAELHLLDLLQIGFVFYLRRPQHRQKDAARSDVQESARGEQEASAQVLDVLQAFAEIELRAAVFDLDARSGRLVAQRQSEAHCPVEPLHYREMLFGRQMRDERRQVSWKEDAGEPEEAMLLEKSREVVD